MESHAAKELKKYGRLGFFSEQPIEREHARTNLWLLKWKNIPEWSKKILLIDAKRDANQNPSVIKELQFLKDQSTRNLSENSKNRSASKIKVKENGKKDYRNDILLDYAVNNWNLS